MNRLSSFHLESCCSVMDSERGLDTRRFRQVRTNRTSDNFVTLRALRSWNHSKNTTGILPDAFLQNGIILCTAKTKARSGVLRLVHGSIPLPIIFRQLCSVLTEVYFPRV